MVRLSLGLCTAATLLASLSNAFPHAPSLDSVGLGFMERATLEGFGDSGEHSFLNPRQAATTTAPTAEGLLTTSGTVHSPENNSTFRFGEFASCGGIWKDDDR